MRNSRLQMLYQTVIKEHSTNQSNKRLIENPSGEMELFNPSCGDLVKVQYRLEDNEIVDIAFQGEGCAISMASASMLTEIMLGKSSEEALELLSLFFEFMKGNEEIDTKPLDDAAYLRGVTKFPTRIRCATLSWHALEEGLLQSDENSV